VIAAVLAFATTGSHRARAQSAVADGARARNRTLRVHGINATFVTAHKPPFPDSRIMLLISVSLSITKFPPEQRVDQDGMIQLDERSSTSTSTASLSTSTKKSQNKTMHRSGRSESLNFRNHFGGHSVMVAVRAICPSPFFSSAALRRRKKTDPQHGPCSCQSWPRRHEADGGQEEPDGRSVSLPSGLPGGGVTCSYRACVRASHWISSYSYSAKRYSVQRYSYSMAV
jgi:hypothetical protein